MTEAVLSCWGIVGCLAVAAACNHGRHHSRDRHLTSRLQRASPRPTPAQLPEEPAALDDDVDSVPT